MAFSRSSLARVSGANSDAGSIWIYTTADTVATANTVDYFLEATGEINLNDIIFIVSSTGGTPVVTINYCNAQSATSIDVTDGLVVTATDSD